MKNNKFFFLFIFLVLINIFGRINIKAEELISFSPSQIIVKENDLGKKYTITITNSSPVPYTFTTTEQLIKTDNTVSTILPIVITNKRLEIAKNEFTVNANSSYELIVRVKIFTNETFESFPALILKEKATNNNQINVLLETIIPFIIQNTKGESKIDSILSINVQNYTLDPKLIVEGTISNVGTKFFNVSGTVVISKNDVRVAEKELTSQIQLSGLFFPQDTRNFMVDWTNDKEYFDGLGEYTVESRITNDETNKTIVNKITFIYIPKNLLLLGIGVLSGIGIIMISVTIIKKIVKKVA